MKCCRMFMDEHGRNADDALAAGRQHGGTVPARTVCHGMGMPCRAEWKLGEGQDQLQGMKVTCQRNLQVRVRGCWDPGVQPWAPSSPGCGCRAASEADPGTE